MKISEVNIPSSSKSTSLPEACLSCLGFETMGDAHKKSTKTLKIICKNCMIRHILSITSQFAEIITFLVSMMLLSQNRTLNKQPNSRKFLKLLLF